MSAWPSTKGLSVYNALKLGGSMTPQQVASYLRTHFDPESREVTDQYVIDGIAFIAAKSWIRQDDSGQLSLLNRAMRAARTDDESDLVLVAGTK